jgi:hypothetical protein
LVQLLVSCQVTRVKRITMRGIASSCEAVNTTDET